MIYRALLEDDFEKLPTALRVFHSTPGRRRAAGTLSVRHHSAFLAWLVRFPPAGDHVPAQLDVLASDAEETWTRSFASVVRRSTQWASAGLLMEQAGPLRIAFRVHAACGGMRFQSQRASIWGIPVPLRVEAVSRGGETSWEIEVEIAHIGNYRGVMEPES
jgi:hypothetical protein